jgi:hypothetical protein
VPPNLHATNQITPPVNIGLSSAGVAGAYTVNATDTGFATAGSTVVTVNLPAISSLNFGSPLTVATGMHQQAVAIILDTPAPAGGLTVNLASTDSTAATVAPSIVILAGNTSSTFPVTGVSTGSQPTQSVQITASAQGWTSQTLNVTVVQPVLVMSGVQTARSVGGAPDPITVLACVISSNCPDVLNAELAVTVDVGTSQIVGITPSQVTTTAGANQSPQLTISSPTAAGTYTVTASAPGFAPVSIVVTVS